MTLKLGIQPPTKKVSIWIIAFLGILLGIIMFTVWLTRIEPLYTWLTPVITPITLAVTNFIPTLQNMWTAFLQNPIPYATAAIGVGSVAYGLISKIRAENVKHQTEVFASQQIMEAQTQLVQQNKALAEAQTQAATLKQQLIQLEGGDASKLLSEAQALISQKNTELQNKNAQIETLMRMIEDLKVKTYQTTVVK